mmetsp:Transcript_55965/g.130813  ORF Transcript_55965/g.130813 Transcript_55965/m.130813 type:complete len:285 (+) Transcript_55965:28-882(+)
MATLKPTAKDGGDPVPGGRGAKLRESMKQLLKSKAPKSAPISSEEQGKVAKPKNDFGYAKFEHIAKEADDLSDAAKRNEAFFRKLEQDYGRLCSEDGWDEVLRASKEQLLAQPSRPEDVIPSSSDYFRVAIPEGQDRELRIDPVRSGSSCSVESPSRPRRNLDAIRKVEQETKEAMEREKQRLADMSRAPKPEPIRTRSDVVHLETLDDSEDDAPASKAEPLIQKKLGEINLDSLSDSDVEEADPEVKQKQDNALAALRAFEEFDRLGRERDAMLAKYRQKYGD